MKTCSSSFLSLRVSFFSLLFLFALTAVAVPAKRERQLLILADGSKTEATWMGDESLHYYLTDDGRYLQCDASGIAHYVSSDELHKRRQAKADRRRAVRKRHQAARRRQSGAMTGSKRGLVILVQFPDVPFVYANDTFERFFNEEGYADDINIGSVHDYFLDASYGQFDFSFDIVGPVTMKDSLYRYGNNNGNGDDIHPAVMVSQAVKMIDNEVDFSQYDWDGDGVVEQIFIVHSGFDEAQSLRRNDIWSHAWYLTEALEEGDGEGPVTVDGVIIDSYATGAELRGKSGRDITGIGTACHEFAHCFGLPDFYDTEGSNFGMSTWDIMDYGEYNGNGGVPAGFTSYERMFCGWLQPTELIEPVRVQDMEALTSKPECYILRNSGKADEYYLLENRQLESWDRCLSAHGMLILHVDYDSLDWAENTVNIARSHQRMTIIPADNMLYKGTLSGDTWPGIYGRTTLSEDSTPAATLYNTNAEGDKLMHHTITEISETSDGLISFIFDEESLGMTPNIATDEDGCTYNLAGQKVSPSYHGIVVRNGKKRAPS